VGEDVVRFYVRMMAGSINKPWAVLDRAFCHRVRSYWSTRFWAEAEATRLNGACMEDQG
jgi:hypothetical protein